MANRNKLKPEKNKKMIFIICIITEIVIFLVMVYAAYCLLSYAQDKRIKAENLYQMETLKAALSYFTNPKFTLPFNFGDVFAIAFKKVWGLYGAIAFAFFLIATGGGDNDYKGIEKGSAKWADNSKYKQFQDHTGIPIGKNFYVTVENPKRSEIGKNPMEISKWKAKRYLKKREKIREKGKKNG